MAKTTKSKSPIINDAQEILDKDSYNMDADQREQYELLASRLNHARTQRDMNRDEWDGMNYNQMYQSNQRAMISYLAPKTNNDDARVNTGTTEKKIEFVLNQILSLNLQGEILAYDKDDMFMEELSNTLTDVVRRTEQMEEAEDKDIFFYIELLSQPCVFVEERWSERKVKDNKGKFKSIKRCERELLVGPQIYLGDINIPDYRFNEQPFIFKYFRMTYDEAKPLFQDFDNWKYIKSGSYNNLAPVPYQIYRKNSLLSNEVEGFVYMCPNDNEYQLLLQGVPMFPLGEHLPWDWDGYNIVCVGLKPFHGDFAYGKSLAQAAKTLQALDNEMIRNFIRKTRQSIEPPTGVPDGKVFSRDIWSPGSMVQGITKDSFSKLIDHQGVNTAEYQMYSLVEKKINEFVGTDAMQAMTSGGRMTAQQTMAMQKIALQMIGLAVIAANRLEAKLAMMRTKNILSHYTKPVGKEVNPITNKIQDVYAQFSMQDTGLSDGSSGTKVIKFMDRGMTPDEQGATFALENKLKAKGKPTEHVAVNAKVLSDLDLYFHAVSVSKPKDAKELEKVMFQDELTQAGMVTQMTGRPISADKATEKFERIWNAKDLFEKQTPQPAPQPGQDQTMDLGKPPAAPGANIPSPNPGLTPSAPPRPSINALQRG